jgi:trehalose synthase
VTKRIHNHLHASPGDGGVLGKDERDVYERALADPAQELASRVRPDDVVFLHDPQTAGMVDRIRATGARVVWRCHIGVDLPDGLARGAWDFLRAYVEDADAYVFSREAFVWDGLDRARTWIVAPSIDAFSPKNQELGNAAVTGILARAGIAEPVRHANPGFVRVDGTPGRVDRAAEVDQETFVPAEASLVTQVSRWDRLKDPVGVLRGFASVADEDAHLLLAGPAATAVADDPEGSEVLAEVRGERDALPPEVRDRTHLACLPMDDVQENAAIVNAIQRRSDVVVQKSLAEGFGLTIAEAMWKSRPVVASGLGGIQDQIADGETGMLLKDPAELNAFARALDQLLGDPNLRERMGAAARERVEAEFLGTRHLLQYLELLTALLQPDSRQPSTQ